MAQMMGKDGDDPKGRVLFVYRVALSFVIPLLSDTSRVSPSAGNKQQALSTFTSYLNEMAVSS